MSNSNKTNGTIEISKAVIGCTGAVLAAIIGGIFLLISSGVVNISFSSNNEPTVTPVVVAATATPLPVTDPSPTSVPSAAQATQASSIATPVPPSTPTPLPLTTGITTADIDQIFGTGNWFCFDGFPNGIGIKKVPSNLVVGNPLFAVDTPSGRYTIGQTVPAGGHATGWLQNNLLNSECVAQVDRSPLTGSELDQILGGNNWYCVSGLPNGFTVVDMPANFVVRSPIIAVDKQEGKFGKGETVPGGGMATVWFFRELPSNQCP